MCLIVHDSSGFLNLQVVSYGREVATHAFIMLCTKCEWFRKEASEARDASEGQGYLGMENFVYLELRRWLR